MDMHDVIASDLEEVKGQDLQKRSVITKVYICLKFSIPTT